MPGKVPWHPLCSWQPIKILGNSNSRFKVFQCESVSDKDKETVPGQSRYTDFEIDVLLKEKSPSSTDTPCINSSIVWRWAVSYLVWNRNIRFKVGHNFSKSGEWHVIPALNGCTLTCCDILTAVLIGFVAVSRLQLWRESIYNFFL